MTDVSATPAPVAAPAAGAPAVLDIPSAAGGVSAGGTPTSTEGFIARDAANPAGADPQPGRDANPPADAPQTPAERRRLKMSDLTDADLEMVIDGKPVTLKAEEAFRRLQRADSANRRYEEAAAARREAQQYQQRLGQALQNPAMLWDELAAAGANPREIAMALYEYEQQQAALTPEQRQLQEYERQIRAFQEQQEQARQQHYQSQVQGAQDAFARDFNAVIDSHSVPADHPLRQQIFRTLASETERVMREEGRRYSKREANELVAAIITPWKPQVPDPTPDDILGRMTPEMVAQWQERQRAAKPVANPPLPRTADQPRLAPGQPGGGRFAREETVPRTDRNGRTIVNSVSDAWRRR